MKMIRNSAKLAVLISLVLQGCNADGLSTKQSATSISSPPPECQMRQRAWCVHREGLEISWKALPNSQEEFAYAWSLRDPHYPNSPLIVFEPQGCREALADTVKAVGFEEGVTWEDKKWDQMRVRLRSDGSCDLKLLVPLNKNDPLEWAFSVGRVLIAACKDDACTPNAPTPADATDQYRPRFMRGS